MVEDGTREILYLAGFFNAYLTYFKFSIITVYFTLAHYDSGYIGKQGKGKTDDNRRN